MICAEDERELTGQPLMLTLSLASVQLSHHHGVCLPVIGALRRHFGE